MTVLNYQQTLTVYYKRFKKDVQHSIVKEGTFY